jgi:hypothetical protein
MGFLETKIWTSVPRFWLTLTVSGAVLFLAFSATTAQQAEAVNDSLIVRTLAPELDGVLLGSLETLDEERKRNLGPEPEDHIRFRYEMDLDSDGQQELVLMGSYADGGRRRSFVLIATPLDDGWARSQLLTFDRDFVIGLGFQNRLAVNFCTGCSTGGWIEWTGSSYEFRPYPEPGVRGIE